ADRPYTHLACRDDLRELAALYPSSIALKTAGHSLWGRPLTYAVLGAGPHKVLAVGGTHGREWMTSLLLARMIEEYAAAARDGRDLAGYDVRSVLRRTTLIVMPMMNPDGVDIAIKGLAAGGDGRLLRRANLGREDFSSWKANGRGVNLNLQFRAGWDRAVSEAGPHYEKYKGRAPESEPEARALADLIRATRPDVVLAYHASGRVIYWYYYQDGSRYRRDLALARELGRLTGYRPAVENRFTRHGGLKDWVIEAFGRPAFTIEIGRLTKDRALPLSSFDEVWRENRSTPLFLGKWLDAR
ncbi:MAG: M14 family metallocarboxypeptidase, partial [Bacteroidota bacterium]